MHFALSLIKRLLLLTGGLTSFAADKFTDVLDAFAFVNFRWSLAADFSAEIANGLLVSTTDGDDVTFADDNVETGWRCHFNRVRVTELHDELGSFHHCSVADADYFQLTLETSGHTVDHVGHESAAQTMQTASQSIVVVACDRQLTVLVLDGEF